MDRNFRELLETRWAEGKFVCVGLDSEIDKIPESARACLFSKLDTDVEKTIVKFNTEIVINTGDLVCAYKPNLKFYLAYGDVGIRALKRTVEIINDWTPNVPVILDAKDMDIGNTNVGSVAFAFEYCGADAITVNPYLGRKAAQPFLDCKDKGIVVLCCTSNPGAGEFQNLPVMVSSSVPNLHSEWPQTRPLYQVVARNIAEFWNSNGNCCLVVGATRPEELAEVRKMVGDMPILIPGIGAQGGDVEKTVNAGKDSRDKGMIINSSRGIIFASNGPDFAEAARRETLKLHDLISQCLSANPTDQQSTKPIRKGGPND